MKNTYKIGLVIGLLLGLMFGQEAILFAKGRIKQFRIAAGDTSNPQTISFITTYGFQPTGLIAYSADGDFTVKVHALGGRANSWHVVHAGGLPFVINKNNDMPIDTLIVLRVSTASSVEIEGYGGE